MIIKELILYFMFGCFGFFLSFFLLRTVNIAIILLMTWVPFKVVENYGLTPDWQLFHRLKELVISLLGTLVDMLSNLVALASIGGMVCFLVGGIAGVVLNMKVKGKG